MGLEHGPLGHARVYWFVDPCRHVPGRLALVGEREGIIAGLILAIYAPLVFTDGQVEKESLVHIFCSLALLFTFTAIRVKHTILLSFIAGGFWGPWPCYERMLSSLHRLEASGCSVAQQHPGPSGLPDLLGLVIGFILPIAPVTVANFVLSHPHEFILTTWQGGAMFYTGNGPDASGVGEPFFVRRDPHLEAIDFAAEAQHRAGRQLSLGEVSSYWMSQGLAQWQRAPLKSLQFLTFKLGLLGNDLEVPDSQSLDWVRLIAGLA